jgi:hypothetical protein
MTSDAEQDEGAIESIAAGGESPSLASHLTMQHSRSFASAFSRTAGEGGLMLPRKLGEVTRSPRPDRFNQIHRASKPTPCHEQLKRVAILGPHRKPELGPPPQHVIGEARPFALHQIAHFRGTQLRTEERPELAAALGVAQHLRQTSALGGKQAMRFRLRQKAPAPARALDLLFATVPGEIAAR